MVSQDEMVHFSPLDATRIVLLWEFSNFRPAMTRCKSFLWFGHSWSELPKLQYKTILVALRGAPPPCSYSAISLQMGHSGTNAFMVSEHYLSISTYFTHLPPPFPKTKALKEKNPSQKAPKWLVRYCLLEGQIRRCPLLNSVSLLLSLSGYWVALWPPCSTSYSRSDLFDKVLPLDDQILETGRTRVRRARFQTRKSVRLRIGQ